MRTAQHRQPQRRRLQQVVAAVGHQAAADEGDVGQGVEEQQLAHGVAEQHLVLRRHRLGSGAAHGGEAFAPAQRVDGVEALGMARHEDQQRVGMAGEQLAVGGEDLLVFAGMGAGGDPQRAPLGSPAGTQGIGARLQLGIDTQVELDRAGDADALGAGAEPAEALGLGLGLRGDPVHLGEHRPGQAGKAGIAAGGLLRQPGVGQHRGSAAPRALVDVVGPQLGFHDQRELRPDPVEEARRRPRQVVGQIAVLHVAGADLGVEQRADALGTGGGHASDGDRQLGMTLTQGADQRRGGDAFTHRNGVHPDAAGPERRQREGEALGQALTVGRRLAAAQVEAQEDQRQGQVQEEAVEGPVHGGQGCQSRPQ